MGVGKPCFVRAFPYKSEVVCNAIAGSGVTGLWAYLFAHKIAIPLEDIYILKGYDAVGEKGGYK